MTFTDLLLVALATWQAVEVYHHSKILAWLRCRLEPLWYLFGCPFCLSLWVALLIAAGVRFDPTWISTLLATALAASRLANLFNDATTSFNRTPKVTCDELNSTVEVV